MITQAELLVLLKERAPRGQQERWALANGVEPSVLSDVLNGRRDPGKSILKALGYERVVMYRKDVSESGEAMSAEWTESYGVAKLDLGIVTVSVAYAMNGNGYQYSFGYFKSSKRYPSMDEAKAAALVSVRKRLTQAIEIVDAHLSRNERTKEGKE